MAQAVTVRVRPSALKHKICVPLYLKRRIGAQKEKERWVATTLLTRIDFHDHWSSCWHDCAIAWLSFWA